MTICLVNNLFPPVASGGTEAVIQTTIDLLRRHGHRVVLITTQATSPTDKKWTVEQSEGLTIYRFRPRNLYYYTDGGQQPVWKKILWHAIDSANAYDRDILYEILQIEKPDAVHGHNLKGMSYTLPGVCAALGLPYVHTLHNYQLLHPYGTFMLEDVPPLFRPSIAAHLYQWQNRRLFQNTQVVISPSALPFKLHQQAGFFTSVQGTILPSPIEIPNHTITAPSPSVILRLVYFGALEMHKGIQDLLAAVQGLPNNNWSLDIYGTGSLANSLKTTTNKNIHWHGYINDKSVLATYDALVYPSRCWETQGLAMAEALAHGTPVIASRIGSIPETIQDGRNGFLYEAGQTSELQQVLSDCQRDPSKLQTLRSAARASAEAYAVSTYEQKLLAIYAGLV